MTLDRFVDGDHLWLLSTGTGLAPFLSILQDFEVWQRFERIVLVYSVRTEDELAYRELLDEILTREYVAEFAHKFTFVPVVTRAEVSGCLNARITDLLTSGELERCVDLPMEAERSRVLLCGNPEMVERFTCATPFIYVRVKQVAVNGCELREQLSKLFRLAVHSGFQCTA